MTAQVSLQLLRDAVYILQLPAVAEVCVSEALLKLLPIPARVKISMNSHTFDYSVDPS